MKILYCTRFPPTANGHGGNHRSYQVFTELVAKFGSESVILLCYPDWLAKNINLPVEPISLKRRVILNKHFRRFENIINNPFRILWKNKYYNENRYSYPEFVSTYIKTLNQLSDDDVICIVDDPGFSKIIMHNQTCGVPTIGMMHDFEALDYSPLFTEMNSKIRYSVYKDFLNELSILSSCNIALAISKVETGFLGGIGISARHYPYYPVGEIRERFMDIRSHRRSESTKCQFLLLGGSTHPSTGAGMKWLLQNFSDSQSLNNFEVLVVGSGTEKLAAQYPKLPAHNFKGYISELELADLLAQVSAVLAPNFSGFGSVTRLPDMSCAGVPVICASHTAVTLNLPPGIEAAEMDWSAWQTKMLQSCDGKQKSSSLEEYEKWESQQYFPLSELIENIIRTKPKANNKNSSSLNKKSGWL